MEHLFYEKWMRELGLSSLEKRRLWGDFQYLKGAYKKDGERLFTSDRTRGNGFKLKDSMFKFDIEKKFFTGSVVRPWYRLAREVVDAPSLEVFKARYLTCSRITKAHGPVTGQRSEFTEMSINYYREQSTKVQHLAFGLVEPHEAQVPLDGIQSFRCVNHTIQLGVICRFAEGTLNPPIHVIDEDIEQYSYQYGPLRDTTCHRCQSGL
ncbi:hypothetical protein BTVI_67692 [Pitangus sulphuratus]|nr:hypothetical protein BTVI_67692 [Pitangus sulphuratus]